MREIPDKENNLVALYFEAFLLLLSEGQRYIKLFVLNFVANCSGNTFSSEEKRFILKHVDRRKMLMP